MIEKFEKFIKTERPNFIKRFWNSFISLFINESCIYDIKTLIE